MFSCPLPVGETKNRFRTASSLSPCRPICSAASRPVRDSPSRTTGTTLMGAKRRSRCPTATARRLDRKFISFRCVFAVRPLEVQVLSSRQPLSAGRTYEVQCQAVGSKPPANITWWKDNERLTNATQTVSSRTPVVGEGSVLVFCIARFLSLVLYLALFLPSLTDLQVMTHTHTPFTFRFFRRLIFLPSSPKTE